MTQRITTGFWIIMLACLSLTASADQFITEASVLSVRPLHSTIGSQSPPGQCLARPPNTALLDLLRWDLECGIDTNASVENFRVVYEIGGRQFTTFTRTAPGDTIDVRIALE